MNLRPIVIALCCATVFVAVVYYCTQMIDSPEPNHLTQVFPRHPPSPQATP